MYSSAPTRCLSAPFQVWMCPTPLNCGRDWKPIVAKVVTFSPCRTIPTRLGALRIRAIRGTDRNTVRLTGACAKSVNRWQKYSRSRAHRNVRSAWARPMKNVPLNKCLTPVSPAKPPAVPLKPVLSAKDLRSVWRLIKSWGLTLCNSVLSPPLTATTPTPGM